MPCRLGPSTVQLHKDFGRKDTPFDRQMAQKAGMSGDEVRGATQDLVLAKLSLAFLVALRDMGMGAHVPADSLDRLR